MNYLIFSIGFVLGFAITYVVTILHKGKSATSPQHIPKKATVFDEDTFFVNPVDVVESYKQSSNVVEFINKIK